MVSRSSGLVQYSGDFHHLVLRDLERFYELSHFSSGSSRLEDYKGSQFMSASFLFHHPSHGFFKSGSTSDFNSNLEDVLGLFSSYFNAHGNTEKILGDYGALSLLKLLPTVSQSLNLTLDEKMEMYVKRFDDNMIQFASFGLEYTPKLNVAKGTRGILYGQITLFG